MASLMPWRQLYYAILASDRSWKPPGRDQRATARGKDPTDVERWAHSSLLSLLMCFSLAKSKIWELNISIQFYTYLNILSATQISVPITGQISLCLSAQAVAAEAQFRPSLLFTMGKPRGIRCARKLRVHRKEALWADKELLDASGTFWHQISWHLASKENCQVFACVCNISFGMFFLKDYKKANLGTKYKCNPFGGKLASAKSLFEWEESYALLSSLICWFEKFSSRLPA